MTADFSWTEIQRILDLPESPLWAPVRVPTITKDGGRSRQLQVVQRRGTRPPAQQTRFTMSAPW